MKYLLDTCAVSDFIKGDKNTHKRLKQTSPHHIYLSTISVMEIQYGLALNPARAKKILVPIKALLKSISPVSFQYKTAEIVGEIRADLAKAGKPIGAYDILIAATALEHKLILVTSNTREFKWVPALVIENWRD